MPRTRPSDSIITRGVVGSIRRQLVRSNGLLQLPSLASFSRQLVHGAPKAQVLCIAIDQMEDGKIRMTVTTAVENRGDETAKAYVLEQVTAENAAATAASLVNLLTPQTAMSVKTFSPRAREQTAKLREMELQECREWLETLAGQTSMRTHLTFRRPSPQATIQIGED